MFDVPCIVGSAEDEKYDQTLDSIMVGPVPVGVNKFVFEASYNNKHSYRRSKMYILLSKQQPASIKYSPAHIHSIHTLTHLLTSSVMLQSQV